MSPLSRWLMSAALAAAGAPAQSPAGLAEQARDSARAGAFQPAFDLYRRALAAAPDDAAIRRDYAVALGWAERYREAREQFRLVLQQQPEQPVWALHEMARAELFGGNPAGALALLDRLIGQGDASEQTLLRKGLAFRWLGRPREAEKVYRELIEKQPDCPEAWVGLAYSLADRDRLERALEVLEQAPPSDWRVAKAKGQILNWMGRHRAARSIFDRLLPERPNDPEILEGRALAARWGGDPATARSDARFLDRSFPSRPSAARLHRELELEYGFSASTFARWIEDSDGLLDRTYAQEFAWHAGPAHRFRFAGQYRRFTQENALAWKRWETGWTGTLGRRATAACSVSSVEYAAGLKGRRWTGDGSLSVRLGESGRIFAAGGSLAMDAYRAVEERVAASFYQAGLSWRPRRLLALDGQFARYRFGDGVRRDRFDVSAFQRIWLRRGLRLELGGRSNSMWHDRETPHFFSPAFFQSHLGALRASGRLGSRFEYRGEVGAGIQREPGVPTQSPFAASAQFAWRIRPSLALDVEAGRTTSSLERVNPGRSPYARRFLALNFTMRWD